MLVMDNARIHHGNEILELVDCFGTFLNIVMTISNTSQVFVLNICCPTLRT
jgi:hypothetical protein